jgi:hypothetical protein
VAAALQSYIKQRGISWTYWCLNPNSGDTGGLLLDDWVTWHDGKQAVLAGSNIPLLALAAPAPVPTATNAPDNQPARQRSAPHLANQHAYQCTPDHFFAAWPILKWETNNFNIFKDWNSSISKRAVKPGMYDKYAMEVKYQIADHGWGGVDRSYKRAQDWTAYTHFNFGFRGTGSGNLIRIEILDDRAPNSTSDTAERFEYIFTDDFTGWRLFKIPFSSFTRRGDWQPEGAPNDGFNQIVWGFNLSPVSGWGSFRVDHFELTR